MSRSLRIAYQYESMGIGPAHNNMIQLACVHMFFSFDSFLKVVKKIKYLNLYLLNCV